MNSHFLELSTILIFAACYISNTDSILTKIIGGTEVPPGYLVKHTLVKHTTLKQRFQGAIIVLGTTTNFFDKGELPWMVSVMVKKENGVLQHICGGTLIDMRFLVTAAHCVIFNYPSDLMILAGASRLHEIEPTRQMRQVDQVKVHPQYDYVMRRNDIARLRVSVPFLEDPPFVSHVSFPPEHHEASGSCIIAGWGLTADNSESGSNVLNKATLPIVPKNQCHMIYQSDFENNTQICAGLEQGGVDGCTGDTGGALICTDLGQRYFAGISSWGYMCALPGYPGVYTEISKFIQWIANGN